MLIAGSFTKTAYFCEGNARRLPAPPPAPKKGGKKPKDSAPVEPAKEPTAADKDNCRDVNLTSKGGSIDAFVGRLGRQDGSLAWVKGFGGPGYDVAQSLAVTKEHVVVLGSFEKTADLGMPDPIDPGDDTGIYLQYLAESNGAVSYAARIGHAPSRTYFAAAV